MSIGFYLKENGELKRINEGSSVKIEDNLTTKTKGSALDASQGKILKEMIDNIPKTEVVQSDWNEKDTESLSFIKNKITKVSQLENDKNFISDISNKMDKHNPNGTGSLSINRLANETIGTNSTTTGSGNIAKATTSSAHGLRTIASSPSSFVYGRYNIEDKDNKYINIVGNGYVDDNDREHRVNIYTLDYDGNGVFAGGVTANGNSSIKGTFNVTKQINSDISIKAPTFYFNEDGVELDVKIYIDNKIEEVLNGIGNILDSINRKVV